MIGNGFDDAAFVSEPTIVTNHFGVIYGSTGEVCFILRHFVHKWDPGQLGIETHGNVKRKLLLKCLTLYFEIEKGLSDRDDGG